MKRKTNDNEAPDIAYDRYVKPVELREQNARKAARREWWRNNWLTVVTLIISCLTLLATVLFGLLPLLC